MQVVAGGSSCFVYACSLSRFKGTLLLKGLLQGHNFWLIAVKICEYQVSYFFSLFYTGDIKVWGKSLFQNVNFRGGTDVPWQSMVLPCVKVKRWDVINVDPPHIHPAKISMLTFWCIQGFSWLLAPQFTCSFTAVISHVTRNHQYNWHIYVNINIYIYKRSELTY